MFCVTFQYFSAENVTDFHFFWSPKKLSLQKNCEPKKKKKKMECSFGFKSTMIADGTSSTNTTGTSLRSQDHHLHSHFLIHFPLHHFIPSLLGGYFEQLLQRRIASPSGPKKKKNNSKSNHIQTYPMACIHVSREAHTSCTIQNGRINCFKRRGCFFMHDTQD